MRRRRAERERQAQVEREAAAGRNAAADERRPSDVPPLPEGLRDEDFPPLPGAPAPKAALHAPAPVPELPTLPHPWQAFWDASSERYYFGHPTTGQVQWDMPVAAPPPPPPPVRPAYTEASYERLVAELAEVRVRPSQNALDILREQECTVEDLCDITHAMLVSAGIDQIDVHMIWSKIEVLRNRRIARESA